MSSPPPFWWENGQEGQRAARKAVQVSAIRNAFSSAQIDVGHAPGGPEQNMQYMFRRRALLVRTGDVGAVFTALQELGQQGVTAQQTQLTGVTSLSLPGTLSTADELKLLDDLNKKLGNNPVRVMPDHVVHIAPAGACPATEPVPTALQKPPIPVPPNPHPVSVVVIDTGFLSNVKTNTPWLANASGPTDSGKTGNYRGHGTFVAGVLAAEAPSVTIAVLPLMFAHGAVIESSLAEALDSALAANPDIISMSAGTTTWGNAAPIALEVVNTKLKNSSTLLVAAAGNDMSATENFYPASFDNVVSVGALDENGAQAGYSNFGPWIDVWARGSNVVNAYPNGVYLYGEPPYGANETATFNNWRASWSGTSFAAPLVAGRIAMRMAVNGGTAIAAWAALEANAPKTGPGGKPILFP
jgi:hypothetical protein